MSRGLFWALLIGALTLPFAAVWLGVSLWTLIPVSQG